VQVENNKIFCSYRKSDADDAETHFLAHYRQFQLVCYRSYTQSRCCFMCNRWVWSLPVAWQRWQSNNSIRHGRKLLDVCKLLGSIFYLSELLPTDVLHCGYREFRVFLQKLLKNI